MKKAWYILTYHAIDWEDSSFVRAIGGSFPPDIFEDHVKTASKHFRLVSVREGLSLLESGIKEPMLSFWFDDGFRGVRDYAFPILRRYGVTGAMSLNSSFMLHKDLYWSAKLSYLMHVDGLRFIRSGLRKLGIPVSKKIRDVIMANFSEDIAELIDRVYREHTTPETREDAWRLFDDVEGARVLLQNDWEICNHSMSHYPVSEKPCAHLFGEHFEQGEKDIQEALGVTTDFWVMPFDRPRHRAPDLEERFKAANSGDRRMVFVGGQLNKSPELHRDRLFRIGVPYTDGNGLMKYLSSHQPYRG
jgi:peptidoglycan/xylan/chitin deacetylase (PgdA/CDA1 family)